MSYLRDQYSESLNDNSAVIESLLHADSSLLLTFRDIYIYTFDTNHATHPSLNNLNDAVKNICESLNRRYNIKDEEDNIFVELSIFLKAVARYIFWNYVYIKTN